jgi:hypothetical protein
MQKQQSQDKMDREAIAKSHSTHKQQASRLFRSLPEHLDKVVRYIMSIRVRPTIWLQVEEEVLAVAMLEGWTIFLPLSRALLEWTQRDWTTFGRRYGH